MDGNGISWPTSASSPGPPTTSTRGRREKDLYHKIDAWKVLKVTKVEGAEVQTASADVEIDGKKLRILVPEGKPLGWGE